MWKTLFMPRARKDLIKLEKTISKRIIEKLEKALINPQKSFQQLTDSPYWKLRVGDYRIIALADEEKKLIEIRRIGHRKNIYNKI